MEMHEHRTPIGDSRECGHDSELLAVNFAVHRFTLDGFIPFSERAVQIRRF